MYALTMPNYLCPEDHVREARTKCIKSWESYDGETPLIILSQGKEQYLDHYFPHKSNIHQYYFNRSLTCNETRYALCLICEKLGIKNSIQIDDDFEVKKGYGREVDEIVKDANGDQLWMVKRDSYFQPSSSNRFIVAPLDDNGKRSITKGAKVWESEGWQYHFITREGFSVPANEYKKALHEMRSVMPKSVFEKRIFGAEDCLCIAYTGYNYGVKLYQVKNANHKTDSVHIPSTVRNKELIPKSPIAQFRASNDIDGFLQRLEIMDVELETELRKL